MPLRVNWGTLFRSRSRLTGCSVPGRVGVLWYRYRTGRIGSFILTEKCSSNWETPLWNSVAGVLLRSLYGRSLIQSSYGSTICLFCLRTVGVWTFAHPDILRSWLWLRLVHSTWTELDFSSRTSAKSRIKIRVFRTRWAKIVLVSLKPIKSWRVV